MRKRWNEGRGRIPEGAWGETGREIAAVSGARRLSPLRGAEPPEPGEAAHQAPLAGCLSLSSLSVCVIIPSALLSAIIQLDKYGGEG